MFYKSMISSIYTHLSPSRNTHLIPHTHTHTVGKSCRYFSLVFQSNLYFNIRIFPSLSLSTKKKSSNCGKFYLVSHLLLNNEKPMSFNVTITLCVMHSIHLDFKIQGYILLVSCLSIVFSLALKKLKSFVFIPPIVFPFPLG